MRSWEPVLCLLVRAAKEDANNMCTLYIAHGII